MAATVQPPIASRFPKAFAEEFERRHTELFDLVGRFHSIADVGAAILAATRGKPFYNLCEPLWDSLTGEAGALVVDLASWLKGMHDRGSQHAEPGWLRRVAVEQAARSALACTFPGADVGTVRLRSEAFKVLFPWAGSDAPSEGDVNVLAAKIGADAEPVRVVRNVHHAHRSELSKQAKRNASVRHLELEEVRTHLESAATFSSALWLLSSNEVWPIRIRDGKAKNTAGEDIADLLLLGPVGNLILDHEKLAAPGEFYWQTRERRYEALHSAHDAAGESNYRPFNDPTANP